MTVLRCSIGIFLFGLSQNVYFFLYYVSRIRHTSSSDKMMMYHAIKASEISIFQCFTRLLTVNLTLFCQFDIKYFAFYEFFNWKIFYNVNSFFVIIFSVYKQLYIDLYTLFYHLKLLFPIFNPWVIQSEPESVVWQLCCIFVGNFIVMLLSSAERLSNKTRISLIGYFTFFFTIHGLAREVNK